MKYPVRIIGVKPWGSGFEGEVQAVLEDGRDIWFYYQGSDSVASTRFAVSKIINVELVGQLCRAKLVSNREKTLCFPGGNCRFEATGTILDTGRPSDGLYLLDSALQLAFDNELGLDVLTTGCCVSVVGELWVANW